MNFQLFLLAGFCFIGITFAAPRPHTGMINDDNVRDVGAVFSASNYGAEGTFILQNKKKSQCMSLYVPSLIAFLRSVTDMPQQRCQHYVNPDLRRWRRV
jgi:hypothetical protein